MRLAIGLIAGALLLAIPLERGAFPGPVGFVGAAGVSAQIAMGTDCQLREDYREFSTRQITPGNRITYVGGPYLICPDGLRIQADSAVVYEASGRTELIGRVRFRHPERELDARLADYYEREGRLFARGDVRFLDLDGNTEILGDTLDYREATAGRPEDQLTVWGRRAWATLPPRAGAGAAGPPPEPYRVGADRLRFEGEDFFWGDGNVEVEREDLRATSDSLAFDQPGGQLILSGNALVERGEVVARGGIVNLSIQDDRLESLRARRDGRIETEDGTVLTGEDVLVRLTEDEEVESVVAEGTDEIHATLTSEEILLVGRTVRIEEGDGTTRIIRASGGARGETSSRAAPFPATEEEAAEGGIARLLDRDWIEGNEIVATFVELPPGSPPDVSPGEPEPEIRPDESSEQTSYQLERLESTGNARTLYRQPPGDEPPETPGGDPDEAVVVDAETGEVLSANGVAALWSISYILADRIVIHLVNGEVDRVEAEGNVVDGIQLDPAGGGSSSARDPATARGAG